MWDNYRDLVINNKVALGHPNLTCNGTIPSCLDFLLGMDPFTSCW